MNHPIITKPLLDLVINQLEKYNEELLFLTNNDNHYTFGIDTYQAEIKVNDSILKELYELKEIKY